MYRTVYGDMHLKDLLGSIEKSRASCPVPGFLSSATWPSLLIKHYNGLSNLSNLVYSVYICVYLVQIVYIVYICVYCVDYVYI